MQMITESPTSGSCRIEEVPPVGAIRGCRKSFVQVPRNSEVLEQQLSALRKEHDELRQAIFEAAQMQRRLCGPRHIRRGAFEFSGEIFPVHHVSGDFISVFDNGADLVFVLGDITGKGLCAGMWFTHLVTTIQRQIYTHACPADALTAINRDLCEARFAVPLTTLFVARLNIATGTVVYCNAGHPAALLLRHAGGAEMLDEGGPILGAVAGARFTSGEATVEPGDSLLAYSDGVVECRNAASMEFGSARLLAAARRSQGSSASSTLFSVLGAAEDFSAPQQRDDDMAVMVLHRSQQSLTGNA